MHSFILQTFFKCSLFTSIFLDAKDKTEKKLYLKDPPHFMEYAF